MTNEWYIYGSSGHGRFARAFPVEGGRGGYKNEPLLSPLYKQSRYLKHKQYELKDHLGNVRVVVSDLKNSKTIGSSNPPYRAEVLAAYNYYPFGMLQPGMYKEGDTTYRFGFNGMLRDDDVTDKLSTGPPVDEGRGNSYDFGARMYNPRVTRFFSLDPLRQLYTSISPFSFALNTPINAIDPEGKNVILIIYTVKEGDVGHAAIAVENYISVQKNVMENGKEVTKTIYEGTGTYTFYELGPQEGIGGAFKALFDQEAYYGESGPYTESELKSGDISVYENHAPEGVLKFNTGYETDKRVIDALNQFKKDYPEYNATSANCSDYSSCGVGAATNSTINAKENLAPFVNTTTPNKLYQEASILPGAQILNDPKEQATIPFKEAYKGNSSDDSKKK
jgi:RHS repeat-associated protein